MEENSIDAKSEVDKKPGFFQLLECKCPRCRRGDMFVHKNPYTKKFMLMNHTCKVCGQHFDLELGFYYGSSYVSYAITVAISIVTFFVWWILVGISVDDNRVFYWLIWNGLFILALQPPLMRISRTGWLAFFIRYDPDWRTNPPEAPERTNKSQKNNW
ncbi:MAG: DUF983 domain-containing protein [Ginsengibacter sp.]